MCPRTRILEFTAPEDRLPESRSRAGVAAGAMLWDSCPPTRRLWEQVRRNRLPAPRFRGWAQSLKVVSSLLAWALCSGWQGLDQAPAGMSGDLYSGSN